MKKFTVLFIILFIFAASATHAQETSSPETSTPTLGMLPVIGVLGDSLVTPNTPFTVSAPISETESVCLYSGMAVSITFLKAEIKRLGLLILFDDLVIEAIE